MKKNILILVLCGLVVTTFAQEKGIQFRDFDSWKALLDASKKENKPIFVDFFTTWCGPCKMLEKDVYSRAEVGDYFNKNYISVKVQIDQTKKDTEQIKKWYPDIKMLEKKFNITGYPTLVFISPNGEIRNMRAGYMAAQELIDIAKVSLIPGQKYVDQTDKYYHVVRDWKNGGDGMAVAKMLNKVLGDETSYFIGREQVLDSLTKVSMQYFNTQPINKLYTNDALNIIGRVGLKSDDYLFKLFYPNTGKADDILGRKNFGRFVVDRTIQKEFFLPDPSSGKKSPLNERNVNWDSLYNAVKDKYNAEYALRSIEAAKAILYAYKRDVPNFTRSSLEFTKKYGTLSYLQIAYETLGFVQTEINSVEKMEALATNAFCWQFVFGHSSDPTELKEGMELLKPLVDLAEKKKSWWFSQCGDTYANLLFKTGDREEAVAVQTRVIEFARKRNYPRSYIEDRQQVLEKMRADIPTWTVPQKPANN